MITDRRTIEECKRRFLAHLVRRAKAGDASAVRCVEMLKDERAYLDVDEENGLVSIQSK